MIAGGALLPALVAAQDTSASQSTFVGLGFPDAVAVFDVTNATRYEDPALGISLSYMSSEIPSELTVYVYPVPKDGGDDPIPDEFDRAWAEIEQYAEQNRSQMELELGAREDVEVAGVDGTMFAGRRGETIVRAGGGALDSLLLLFLKDGWFIKYRITYERPSRLVIEPHVDSFLRTTLASIDVPTG